jgi:hypothetical protein
VNLILDIDRAIALLRGIHPPLTWSFVEVAHDEVEAKGVTEESRENEQDAGQKEQEVMAKECA